MNIIGFNASPRKTGSTAWALSAVLAGAEEQTSATQLFQSRELNIQPCLGCMACTKGEGCIQKDDMQQIYAALKTANAVVIGVPIYMGQMSAQAKLFADRLFAQTKLQHSLNSGEESGEEQASKKLVLVWTQGSPDSEGYKTYLDYTEMMFGMLGFAVQDVVVVPGTGSQAASEQTGLAERLAAIGARLATQ